MVRPAAAHTASGSVNAAHFNYNWQRYTELWLENHWQRMQQSSERFKLSGQRQTIILVDLKFASRDSSISSLKCMHSPQAPCRLPVYIFVFK